MSSTLPQLSYSLSVAWEERPTLIAKQLRGCRERLGACDRCVCWIKYTMTGFHLLQYIILVVCPFSINLTTKSQFLSRHRYTYFSSRMWGYEDGMWEKKCNPNIPRVAAWHPKQLGVCFSLPTTIMKYKADAICLQIHKFSPCLAEII